MPAIPGCWLKKLPPVADGGVNEDSKVAGAAGHPVGERTAMSQDAPQGDIWLWLPDGNVSSKDSQIVRNKEYVSIKLQSVYAYYHSGFLENVKQLVVTSEVSFDLSGNAVRNTMVNKSFQKSKDSGDFLGVNDHLAVLSPATPNSVQIKVGIAGIGEDRFKAIFDVLSNGDLKTALNLSPAALARAGLATSIVQKFLASPYTSSKPRQILTMSQSFVIYPDQAADRSDALRKGRIVIISGRENKSSDLSAVLQNPGRIRLSSQGQALELQAPDGSWELFTGNSYVILTVTQDTIRGEDEGSSWSRKYSDAIRVTERLQVGEPLDKIKKGAYELWDQGNILLENDVNYLANERTGIRAAKLREIEEGLKKQGISDLDANLGLAIPGVPFDYSRLAAEYKLQVSAARLVGDLQVRITDSKGAALQGAMVKLRAMADSSDVRTAMADQSGEVSFTGLKPGEYSVEAAQPGFSISVVPQVSVQPRETKSLRLRVASGPKGQV